MNHETARKLAMEFIWKCWGIDDDEPFLLDEYTQVENFGWVFFWTSRKYHETKDIRHALGGNGPVVVMKETSQISILPTCYSIEQQIENLRRGGVPEGI